jgi:hypothetical protein
VCVVARSVSVPASGAAIPGTLPPGSRQSAMLAGNGGRGLGVVDVG